MDVEEITGISLTEVAMTPASLYRVLLFKPCAKYFRISSRGDQIKEYAKSVWT